MAKGKTAAGKKPADKKTPGAATDSPAAPGAGLEGSDSSLPGNSGQSAPGGDQGASDSAASDQSGAPRSDDGKGKGKGKKSVPALFIRSKPQLGFRRCGFRFEREGFGIALDALTADQVQALRNEPNLIVEESEIEL
jgi:hypothetical protein